MDFKPSNKVRELCHKLQTFMKARILPVEDEFRNYMATTSNKWETPLLFEKLKEQARNKGLWNLFLKGDHYGAGLTNLEYAPLAEIMGQVWWAAEIFNCNAPDTGNMETLVLYGTDAQKMRWLEPLLEGKIRSAFAMTEPDVASSDATNIRCSIKRDGDEYVINGRKWFTTGVLPALTLVRELSATKTRNSENNFLEKICQNPLSKIQRWSQHLRVLFWFSFG